MKKSLSLLLILVSFGFSHASFDEIYNSFINNLENLNQPSIVKTITNKGNALGSMNTININMQNTSTAQQGSFKIQANTVISTTGSLQASGSISVTGKGNLFTETGAIQGNLDYRLQKDNVYAKFSNLQLPFGEEVSSMASLFSNQWLKIPLSSGEENLETIINAQTMQTKAFADACKKNSCINNIGSGGIRNGYEVYAIQINPEAIQEAMGSLVPEIRTELEDAPKNFKRNISHYGVIGKKGDEIKMALLFKKKKTLGHKENAIITYSGKPDNATLGLVATDNNKPVFTASLQSTNTSSNTNTTTITANIEDEANFQITVDSNYYDAGTLVLEAPTTSINIEDIAGY